MCTTKVIYWLHLVSYYHMLYSHVYLVSGIVYCPGTTLLTAKDINSRLISSKADAIIVEEANVHKIQEVSFCTIEIT